MSIEERLSSAFWAGRRLPVFVQTEAAECGLACLAMVSTYWGHKIDVSSMRKRFPVSLKGVTLRGLITMAGAMLLHTRPLKLDMEDLPELKLPCILHWDLNHFVVLASVRNGHAVIHDPRVGVRRMALAEFAKHFTGVALELTPGSGFEKVNETQKFTLLSLVGKRIVGLRRGAAQLVLLGLALQVCALVAPFYLQWIVDEALVASDRDLVTVLGCGFLLLVIVQVAIGAVRSWITSVLATDLNLQWLGNAFVHMMRLPLQYFEKRNTGDIVSRFSSIQTIQHSLTSQFVEAVLDGVLVVCTLAMLLCYSLQLTAVALLAVLLYAILRLILYRRLKEASAEEIIHGAKQSTHFLESVRGMQSIRLFGRSDERAAAWMNHLADQFNAQLKIARLTVSYQSANSLLFGIERVAVIWLAALAVMDHAFSAGMLFAFLSYKDQFTQRTAGLIDKAFELRMLRLHGERVADIVLTEPEEQPHLVECDVEELSPSIEFRNVTFQYSAGEPELFKQLNLHVPAHQCVAVTGASGCGKTTLMKILLGLLNPGSGEILLGGVRMTELGPANFRKLIGTVMQDDTLFAGSIADNIAFFDPAPDMAHVHLCAASAGVADEIKAMPMGFNTLIGDIGSGLSGGQKQRLLLARALYRRPKILVLDEATSHLDVWNEQTVNAAIKNLQLTRIIVAHRPETIAMAERVIVLHEGQIVRDIVADEAATMAA